MTFPAFSLRRVWAGKRRERYSNAAKGEYRSPASNFMKQAEKNEMARIARLTGKCIQCGEDTGTDKKGINFVNCAIHREAISRKRRPAHFALPKKRDFDPDYCMFDTKEWRQFCVEVFKAEAMEEAGKWF